MSSQVKPADVDPSRSEPMQVELDQAQVDLSRPGPMSSRVGASRFRVESVWVDIDLNRSGVESI